MSGRKFDPHLVPKGKSPRRLFSNSLLVGTCGKWRLKSLYPCGKVFTSTKYTQTLTGGCCGTA